MKTLTNLAEILATDKALYDYIVSAYILPNDFDKNELAQPLIDTVGGVVCFVTTEHEAAKAFDVTADTFAALSKNLFPPDSVTFVRVGSKLYLEIVFVTNALGGNIYLVDVLAYPEILTKTYHYI